ncbi:hypothetical protein ACFV6F_16565 [Kitasatospora phosalacinea]|uniref:hypothetical protein n=1 Tax=Kitasatospora phosalacinea TaxID=2065 RepID=UPI0036549EF5
MRSIRLAVRASGLLAAAVLAVGCSSGGSGTVPGREGLPSGAPFPESAGAFGAAPSPSQVDLRPEPSGEVVHGSVPKDGGYAYTAQLVGGVHSAVALPGVPVPTGKTALLVRLKLASDPVERSSMAPPDVLVSLEGDWCGQPGNSCRWMDGSSQLVAESSVRAGNRYDTVPMGDAMDANTVYYRYYWQFVPEGSGLSNGKLCFTQNGSDEICTPLGPVTPLAGPLGDNDLL